MKKHDYNYHGHTYLCGHATGVPLDYVKEAIKHNFKELGISEHAPISNLKDSKTRLSIDNYDLYIDYLNIAKEEANKNGINFYKALEIEYFYGNDIYSKYLKDMDYLILGQHYIEINNELKSSFDLSTLEEVRIYAKTVVDAINTGFFSLIAHPELCFNNIENPTDEMYDELIPIIEASIKMDIPLEINANGIRKLFNKTGSKDLNKLRYPRIKFLKQANKMGAKFIISSDCHHVDLLNDWAINQAYDLANDLNLNLINRLVIKK